ncbi:MAG: hypothetical protein QNJ85_16260 [Gammaproteobacteria bacterium]|nr:hypothetical protein [Gammaproteobacteria bacterium]
MRIKLPLATIAGIFLSALALLYCIPASASEAQLRHLRLVAVLDRPMDGYCVDILGVGQWLRVDLPLFAHNCKPALTVDSAVVMRDNGQLHFPAVDRCITVAGVNARALPGASVLLRPCDESGPFFETPALQRFVLHADGRLTLAGSDLCLAVGERSATTYSSADRWRALFVADCSAIEAARARWQLAVP